MAIETPRDVAAAWQPQRPGRRGARTPRRDRTSPTGAACASSRRSPRTRSRSTATAARRRSRRAAPGAARLRRGGRGRHRGPRDDGGAAVLVRRLPVHAQGRAPADPRPARDPRGRQGRPVRPGARLRTGRRPAESRPSARRWSAVSGTRSSRPTCCGWTAPRSPTFRCSSGVGSSRASSPDPFLVRISAIVRPSAIPDAVNLGRARLPQPVVPRRELALPRGPGAARLGRGPRPRHAGRRAEARRAALTTTPPASSTSRTRGGGLAIPRQARQGAAKPPHGGRVGPMPPSAPTPAIRDEIARLGRADIMVGTRASRTP